MNFVKPETADISAFSPLKRISNEAVRWTDGFWHDRRLAVRDQGVQSLLEALDDPENGTYFPNFRHSAEGIGTHCGKEWSDGDCYKVIETMILIYDTDGGDDLDAKIDEMIGEIASAQEEDGYICTQITMTDKERWTEIHDHELYNFGHLFTAAVLHHQVTGKTNFLNIAIRAADYLYETFITHEPALAKFCFNPSQIMGLVELYRETQDQKYLELAQPAGL
ncbi:beta-L-arabinofuranosidase domain-containing protein [Ruegeria jejuensis]|uniref:beta-L-arabinofuranosidase domain-containing protein n=1 Tax=Ruegeria jejuensis TaxID=3233338 RepID=UPI00355C3284